MLKKQILTIVWSAQCWLKYKTIIPYTALNICREVGLCNLIPLRSLHTSLKPSSLYGNFFIFNFLTGRMVPAILWQLTQPVRSCLAGNGSQTNGSEKEVKNLRGRVDCIQINIDIKCFRTILSGHVTFTCRDIKVRAKSIYVMCVLVL